ncbi:MAG: hydroxymethylglutaryl-CoA synthase [Alphaproteobacteria bacterium]|nr:hydroxymethylglutaryl-CoA synthase [Alphaproteobacteria bacterium]
MRFGLSSIGIKLAPFAFKLDDLAKLRNQDPEKYRTGLGCLEMGLCMDQCTVADLAIGAAERALSRWPGKLEDIGLLAVGTESSLDESRPLSAWVAQALGIKGHTRSYEIKHGCFGGTAAVRQALEWKHSGCSNGRAALVIAADVSEYAPGNPGEATQGAGAIAMIIDQPTIAEIELQSYCYSEPAFDFWRPFGAPYPEVNGSLSIDCYTSSVLKCFEGYIKDRKNHSETPEQAIESFSHLCFHSPYPKLVWKGLKGLLDAYGYADDQSQDLFKNKASPVLEWNRKIGNAYTASLWISVAQALSKSSVGQSTAAFSYGSGFCSELLFLKKGAESYSPWVDDVQNDLDSRLFVDVESYAAWRGKPVFVSDNDRHVVPFTTKGLNPFDTEEKVSYS